MHAIWFVTKSWKFLQDQILAHQICQEQFCSKGKTQKNDLVMFSSDNTIFHRCTLCKEHNNNFSYPIADIILYRQISHARNFIIHPHDRTNGVCLLCCTNQVSARQVSDVNSIGTCIQISVRYVHTCVLFSLPLVAIHDHQISQLLEVIGNSRHGKGTK